MVDVVSADNGKGGTLDANNREYGGSIENRTVVVSPPVGTIGGTRITSSFNQSPSSIDIGVAGGNTHYVFGRANGKVYVYTSNGVQAVIPFKKFVTPKQ